MMGLQAEKMIFIYQKMLLTRLKSRRLAGKPITPIFHYSIIPLRPRPRPPSWRRSREPIAERRVATLYIFLGLCQ